MLSMQNARFEDIIVRWRSHGGLKSCLSACIIYQTLAKSTFYLYL